MLRTTHVFEDVIVPILPTYRDRVSTGRRAKDIRMGFRVNPAGERFGGQAWTATVTDESGSEWARLTGTLAEGEMTVPLEMPVSRKAPAGDYSLTVSVDDANGGSVTRSSTFKIVAPKATQILVDQDGCLLRNGKPYFPMGVYGSNDDDSARVKAAGFNNMTPYAPGQGGEDKKETVVSLTVSNVVVQYVFNSVQPGSVVPQTTDPGFVNVITEMKGGSAIAIPSTWADRFPKFQEWFGQDFARALMQPSGKVGAYGPMQVWQDFVAGTDPTDPDDRFVASITVADGKPVVSWTPELKPEDAARRVYTTYGKARLGDAEWTVVDGDVEKYNFFRVTVEMRP